jgi:asparagine synthase (glutamine-hydrolysing)
MCAIFGIHHPCIDGRKEDLETMGNILFHRGPDGEGYYNSSEISMGMRRLSILDIEGGNQPFFSQDGRVVVLCNGEIYNHKELRRELEAKGIVFTTNSDIEILPHLYHFYGPDFVKKLNGMFAISLWDDRKKRLFLYRDHIGIKPIYYYVGKDTLVYASEMKAIAALDRFEGELNISAASCFLDLGYIPNSASIFNSVERLEPGTYIIYDGNQTTKVNYWSLELEEGIDSKDINDLLSEIEPMIKESINMQCVCDVPLGSYLSGGVDSSLVTALSAIETKGVVQSFHLKWNNVEGKTDESQFANTVAENYNIDHHTFDSKDINILELLPKLVWHLDEPNGDAAFVPTYLLSKRASKDIKVILSGAGGDELYGGYSRYLPESRIKSFLKKIFFHKDVKNSYYDTMTGIYSRKWKRYFPWYNRDNVEKKSIDNLFKYALKIDRTNAKMLLDVRSYLVDNILFITDKMSSAASLECRVPLLDVRLVEHSMKIPSEQKIPNGQLKHLLKKIASKYVDPHIIYREKEGFGSPVWDWIDQYKISHFDKLIFSGYLVSEMGLVHLKDFNKAKMKKSDYWMYWRILVLEIWYRIYVKKIECDQIFDL